ncbi:hypothetical protein BH23PLA1_BH23PLA1_23550 [soil metagenome]
MEIAIQMAIFVIILGMTYALMSEGLWGAALMFFNILFASVLAFNFYEPIAKLITDNAGSWSYDYADAFSLTLLFLILIVILRITTDSLGPMMVRFPNPVFHIGRIVFGFAGSALAVGFMLVAYHTAPVHKRMFGAIDYNTRPPFGMGLDHRFLALFQYSTGYPFSRTGSGLVDPEFGDTYVFDPKGRWLIDHETARPYGQGRLDELQPQSASTGGGAAGAEGQGMGIPGGTAGAAAGLAPANPF